VDINDWLIAVINVSIGTSARCSLFWGLCPSFCQRSNMEGYLRWAAAARTPVIQNVDMPVDTFDKSAFAASIHSCENPFIFDTVKSCTSGQGRSLRGSMAPQSSIDWIFYGKNWLCWDSSLYQKCSVDLKYAKNVPPRTPLGELTMLPETPGRLGRTPSS